MEFYRKLSRILCIWCQLPNFCWQHRSIHQKSSTIAALLIYLSKIHTEMDLKNYYFQNDSAAHFFTKNSKTLHVIQHKERYGAIILDQWTISFLKNWWNHASFPNIRQQSSFQGTLKKKTNIPKNFQHIPQITLKTNYPGQQIYICSDLLVFLIISAFRYISSMRTSTWGFITICLSTTV